MLGKGKSRKRAIFRLMILTIAFVFSTAALAYIADEKFDRAFYRLKQNNQLQFDFPLIASPEPRQSSGGNFIIEFFRAIANFLGPFLEIVFWVFITLFVIAIIYTIFREIIRSKLPSRASKAKRDETVKITPYQPKAAMAKILLSDADKLAAQGAYAGAIHILLFRSIQDIEIHHPNAIRRSLTSREILQLPVLTAQSRQTFGLISQFVERAFFAGQPLDQAAFETCRQAYAGLALKEGQAAS